MGESFITQKMEEWADNLELQQENPHLGKYIHKFRVDLAR
jgi:hypothetical protein